MLKAELEKEISKIIKKYENKMLKCSLDFHFMSHYLYELEKFEEEAGKLSLLCSQKGKSDLSNYKEADRLLYLK